MRITVSDLEKAVKNLNESYMGKSKNEFRVSSAYGGYQVVITGKYKKVRGKGIYLGMGSGEASVTYGYVSARDALAQLAMVISDQNSFKNMIKFREK